MGFVRCRRRQGVWQRACNSHRARGAEMNFRLVVASVALAAVTGCSPPASNEAPAATAPTGAAASPDQASVVPEELRGIIDTPFTGDLDQLASRRIIRAGVPFNRTFYF